MSLAIVFPGQGSQSVGMMQGFADLPIVEKTFLEANAILGVDLWTLVREGPDDAWNQTANTQPSAERLAKGHDAVEVTHPLVPMIHNRFVESFDDPARIRQALVEQLCNPVRWIETIEFLGHKGVRRVVECGPGKVLTGLSKRIVPDIEYIALNDAATLAAASAQV